MAQTPSATQDLILLGLLKESPKHGYELKQVIQERLSQIASISSGTVYYALGRLARRGLIEETRDRVGNRPERVVYAITAAGEAEFKRLLRECLFVEDRPYFNFDAGLYFVDQVDPTTLLEAIDHHLDELRGRRSLVHRFEREHPGRWPYNLYYIKQRALLNIDANESWFLALRNKLLQKMEAARQTGAAVGPLREPDED